MEELSTIKIVEPKLIKIDKKSSKIKNTFEYFANFCDNTSIHGFKFLGEKRQQVLDKIFWLAVILASFYGSYKLIHNTYTRWSTSPIVVTFAMTETPIWKIPFPAVTICSEIKVDRYEFNYTDVSFRFSDYEENVTKKELKYYKLFSLVCNDDEVFSDDDETKLITVDDFDDLEKAFQKVEMENCNWLGKLNNSINCDDLFSDTLTSEGWCKTFNMLDYNDLINFQTSDRQVPETRWSLESGYAEIEDLDTFPRRTILSGIKGGLQVDLTVYDVDLDYVCSDLQGFKVTLHHPAEEPDMDKHFRVPLNQVVIAGIKPKMITTSDDLRAYSSEQRLCYLSGEKILSTYKMYNQQNCLSECLLNFTYKQCNCVPFYMASYLEDFDNCGPGSKDCMNEAKLDFLKYELQIPARDRISKGCGCLPSCTDIEFQTETSQNNWDWKQADYRVSVFPESSHMSRLQLYFKDSQFMTSERHEFYGIVDFLANCGGLLGLFCGFSLISLVEIFYYLSLRLIGNLMKRNTKIGRVIRPTTESGV